MTGKQTDAINGVARYPAPWQLRGNAYMLVYRFPKHFAMEHGQIPAFLRASFVGGLGAVMIVDYAESNAGPYSELLFMPGKFRFREKKQSCITRIYVSTRESVVNGWENWAIPKERADFRFAAAEGQRRETVVVTKDGKRLLDVTLRHGRISFPMHTRLLPFPLVQEKDGKLYYTDFTGSGMAHFARIEAMQVDPELFPDLAPFHPLMALRVHDFTLTFPVARITDM